MFEKVSYNFQIAVDSIKNNKLRSLLTSLGLIFGVASVIAMLAIGKGAEQEILRQIRLLGARNVIIRPIVEQEEGPVEENQDQKAAEQQRFSPGLTMADARSIARVVPHVTSVSPEIVVETEAIRAGLHRSARLVGVSAAFFGDRQVQVAKGQTFSPTQIEQAASVAIIGSAVKTKFFLGEEAIGRRIK